MDNTLKLNWRDRRTSCFGCGRSLERGTFEIDWSVQDDNARSEVVFRCPESERDECARLTRAAIKARNVAWRKEWIRNKLALPRRALPLP